MCLSGEIVAKMHKPAGSKYPSRDGETIHDCLTNLQLSDE